MTSSMATLAPRRFPDRITRLREIEGHRNSAGEYVSGGTEEFVLLASVQPVELGDIDAEEGARLSERIVVYVPEPDALLAAFDDSEADRVRWQGREYTVIQTRSWSRGHCRAACLREV